MKIFKRSLILMLGVLMMGMIMGCGGDDDPIIREIASEYRGIYIIETVVQDSPGAAKQFEFTTNSIIITNNNNNTETDTEAFTESNYLYVSYNGRHQFGYFSDNKFTYTISGLNRVFIKQ
jgi:hypothetical protein